MTDFPGDSFLPLKTMNKYSSQAVEACRSDGCEQSGEV